jgi:hypothetical protein
LLSDKLNLPKIEKSNLIKDYSIETQVSQQDLALMMKIIFTINPYLVTEHKSPFIIPIKPKMKMMMKNKMRNKESLVLLKTLNVLLKELKIPKKEALLISL